MNKEEKELLKVGTLIFMGVFLLLCMYKVVSNSSDTLEEGIYYLQMHMDSLILPLLSNSLAFALILTGGYLFFTKKRDKKVANFIGVGALLFVISVSQFGFLASSFTAPSGWDRQGTLPMCVNSEAEINILPMISGSAGGLQITPSDKLQPFTIQRTRYSAETYGTSSWEQMTFKVNGKDPQTCTLVLNPNSNQICVLSNAKGGEVALAVTGISSKDTNWLNTNKEAFREEWIASGSSGNFDDAWANYLACYRKFTFTVLVKHSDKIYAECTEGKTQTAKCEDGSTIVKFECINGEWDSTGEKCAVGGDDTWLAGDITASSGGTEDDTVVECPDPLMTMDAYGACKCPEGYEKVNSIWQGTYCKPISETTTEDTTGETTGDTTGDTGEGTYYPPYEEEQSITDYIMNNLLIIGIIVLALVGGLIGLIYALEFRRR